MNEPRRNKGYTLIEMMVTSALLTGMFAITGTVLVRTVQAWRMQEAYTGVTAGLRDATLAITQELESAALKDDSSLSPPVKGLTVSPDTISVTYQVPMSLDGTTWSNPITIRLRTEDKNLNLKMDGKEDEDGNGFLDRVIERLEDLNGDKEYTKEGETRILARGIDRLTFAKSKDGSKIDVTVAARFADLSNVQRTLSEENVFTVAVRN